MSLLTRLPVRANVASKRWRTPSSMYAAPTDSFPSTLQLRQNYFTFAARSPKWREAAGEMWWCVQRSSTHPVACSIQAYFHEDRRDLCSIYFINNMQRKPKVRFSCSLAGCHPEPPVPALGPLTRAPLLMSQTEFSIIKNTKNTSFLCRDITWLKVTFWRLCRCYLWWFDCRRPAVGSLWSTGLFVYCWWTGHLGGLMRSSIAML